VPATIAAVSTCAAHPRHTRDRCRSEPAMEIACRKEKFSRRFPPAGIYLKVQGIELSTIIF
jgi:hypothetical protein